MTKQEPDADWPCFIGDGHVLEAGTGPEALERTLTWFEHLAEHQGWPPKAVFAMSLCLDEAATNIISYADRDDGAQVQIRIEVGPTHRGIGVLLRDDGRPFDPTARESAPLAQSLEEARIGGHGLRLMRHYLSRLAYRREGGWNLLWLELKLA